MCVSYAAVFSTAYHADVRDDVTCVYDDVTYVYDDVTYVYDDVTYVGGIVRGVLISGGGICVMYKGHL